MRCGQVTVIRVVPSREGGATYRIELEGQVPAGTSTVTELVDVLSGLHRDRAKRIALAIFEEVDHARLIIQ